MIKRVSRLMEQDLKDAKYVKSIRTSWKQAASGELYNWKEILPDGVHRRRG